MTRHCSTRSWQRLKGRLKTLPVVQSIGFSALGVVGMALKAFDPVRMDAFYSSSARQADGVSQDTLPTRARNLHG
jgi:hypothetical protein